MGILFLFGVWLVGLVRRYALGLKAAFVMLHLIYVGVLFLFDGGLIEKTKRESWYAISSLLFVYLVF
ncbi:hypothetical protein RchiOBHm_Chr3g0494861 [Rosa chinensis]|uniref:Uncharacterized protein n=1 Tax=Rosa chinensis TaxID=74649 RepID=A0A2P6RH32_ROSCH|nr:hypothetical protein RchiOBHm_Chr3g0494861 [Rosa chinensis]